MNPTTIELMKEQVDAIYRAVTGEKLREEELPSVESEVPEEEVARRFADLETIARQIPSVMERVPPFSFAPPLDVIDEQQSLLVEIAAPGVDREDIKVECDGEVLVISGVRRGGIHNGFDHLHAEIPRGPFHRVIDLPCKVSPDAKIELDRGLVRIHLTKGTPASA